MKYIAHLKCKNCNAKTTEKIERGLKVQGHLERNTPYCPVCGCPTLVLGDAEATLEEQ